MKRAIRDLVLVMAKYENFYCNISLKIKNKQKNAKDIFFMNRKNYVLEIRFVKKRM